MGQLEEYVFEEKKNYRSEVVDSLRTALNSFSNINHGWTEEAKHNLVMTVLGNLSYVTKELVN